VSEKHRDEEAPEEGALFREKSAAQSKWDEERGAEFVYVAEWMRRGKSSSLYVYELIYRVDLLNKDDPMLMVKGVQGEAPVVAFVYSPGLLTGMANLAGLFRSGKLKWRDDHYVSGKLKQVLGLSQEG